MKKLVILCLAFLTFGADLLAQQVIEGQQPFRKKESANALYVEIEGQRKNIEDIMEEKFKVKTGKRSKNDKGVRMYESARVPVISASTMNYYYDVEEVKGSKNRSVVRLFIDTGPKNFLNSAENPSEMLAAREIMENLQYETTVYEFELAIKEQQGILEKAEKEYASLETDSVKLEETLQETLADIEKNKADRKNQKFTLEEEYSRLDALREEMEAYIRESQDWRTTRGSRKN